MRLLDDPVLLIPDKKRVFHSITSSPPKGISQFVV